MVVDNDRRRPPPQRRSSIARSASRHKQRLPSMELWTLAIVVSICYFCLSTLYSTYQRSFFSEPGRNLEDEPRSVTSSLQDKPNGSTTRDDGVSHPLQQATPKITHPSMLKEYDVEIQKRSSTWSNEDSVDAKVCPDCFSRRIHTIGTCGDRINKYYKESGKYASHQEARLAVARDHPDECGVCDPSACTDEQTIFRRPDRMGPPIQAATTHYLTSIASENRVPPNVNRMEYFSKEENVHPQRRYLFEYNPSIIVIPDDQRVDVEGETAYYLASYRVSNLQQCITGQEEYLMLGKFDTKRPRQYDYLALALLRKDLSILHDVVLDLRSVVHQRMEDFRLFVFPPNNQIVVTSFDFIFPIWLQQPNITTLPTSVGEIVAVPQYSPSTMQVYARTTAACTPFIPPGSGYNKNINFFVDDHGDLIAEHKPMNSKFRMPSLPIEPCVRGNNLEPEIKSALPIRSFDTVDILHFWNQSLFQPYTEERGSACCVPIVHPKSGAKLVLGLSHSKTPYPRKGHQSRSGTVQSNIFFTSLYAMEASYPYTVVARSGRFCLGHALPPEVEGNPFARSNLTPMQIDREYDCPRIHFVSGLSEVVDDPSSVIIGYGINDCAPRFVRVKKEHLVQLLFV